MNQTKKLHLRLVVRLLAVAAIVSIVVALLAVQNERGRVLALAKDRALIRADTLRTVLLDRLDGGDLDDRAGIEASVAGAAYHGPALATGRYVYLRILDPGFREVARVADPAYDRIAALEKYAESGGLPAPADDGEAAFASARLGGRECVLARVPLRNSRGAVAAWAEGVFVPSPEEQAAARRRLLRAVALAIGTVLLTTALLYPIILGLMKSLARLSLNLLDSNLEMLQVVGSAIAKRDSDTDAHNYRVTIYSSRIGEALGLDDDAMRALIKGAMLHDVGKIGIADAILLKPARLDETEFAVMREHVTHGLDIVNRSAWLKDSAPVVGGHHEKYDGTGYFGKLKGPEIPLEARIFAVADVFDAVTSHRPYHEPLGYEDAMGLLVQGRGSHFDPEIVDAFERIARALHDRYADRDDELLRSEHAAIVDRYYRADITAFMS